MICLWFPSYQQHSRSLLDRCAGVYSVNLSGNLWLPCDPNITAGEPVRFTLGGGR